MRTAFVKRLLELADLNAKIWLLNGDLGYKVLDVFAEKHPSRYVNAGVAEQNMIGVAAGLAMTGKTVVVYSIANFPTFRCLEQIRNDVCYHNLSVKIVAVGAGFTYGAHGYTHHGIEDLGIMRVLPNMTIYSPGDPIEAAAVTEIALNSAGPAYIRLGKAGEPILHKASISVDQVLSGVMLSSGTDLCIIATGSILKEAVSAVQQLSAAGYSVSLMSLPCLKPLDKSSLVAELRKYKRLITVEEHGIGGLYTTIAESIAASGLSVDYIPIYLSGSIIARAGHQQQLRAQAGITMQDIIAAAINLLKQ
jgi:transketolase